MKWDYWLCSVFPQSFGSRVRNSRPRVLLIEVPGFRFSSGFPAKTTTVCIVPVVSGESVRAIDLTIGLNYSRFRTRPWNLSPLSPFKFDLSTLVSTRDCLERCECEICLMESVLDDHMVYLLWRLKMKIRAVIQRFDFGPVTQFVISSHRFIFIYTNRFQGPIYLSRRTSGPYSAPEFQF